MSKEQTYKTNVREYRRGNQ